jgi:hypothetical protein
VLAPSSSLARWSALSRVLIQGQPAGKPLAVVLAVVTAVRASATPVVPPSAANPVTVTAAAAMAVARIFHRPKDLIQRSSSNCCDDRRFVD